MRIYTREVLEGLNYLHKQRIMHRDIKGHNVLVDQRGCTKLADFGASTQIHTVMDSVSRDGALLTSLPHHMHLCISKAMIAHNTLRRAVANSTPAAVQIKRIGLSRARHSSWHQKLSLARAMGARQTSGAWAAWCSRC